MKKPLLATAVAFSSLVSGVCMSDSGERLTIDRQIRLSPGHQVMPYSISRASNGDLIIFGANNMMDYRPWATRIAQTGEVRWEYLEGGGYGWEDQTQSGQRFSSAVEMANQVTLLCGIKIVNKQRSIVLSRIGLRGDVIDERSVRPDTEKGSVTGAKCVQWNDGIAVVGGVSGSPTGTGWIAKLDQNLNILWQKFGDQFGSSHLVEGADGSLLYINSLLKTSIGSSTSLVKLGPTAEVVASHAFSNDDGPIPVYSTSPGLNVRVALFKDTLHTEIVDLDSRLQGPTRVIKLHNVGVKKSIELPDGSLAIFGSEFHNVAIAAVARVYKDGSSKAFQVDPSVSSPWYLDAVSIGVGRNFAAVRMADGHAQLDWLSFK